MVLRRGNHKSIDTIPQDGGQENKQGGVLDPSILFLSVECSVTLLCSCDFCCMNLLLQNFNPYEIKIKIFDHTVRNIIPAVPGLGKVPPNIGRENLHKIVLYESKIHLGVPISLLVQKRMMFCLFCSIFQRIGTML